ncbi:MAG: hypothetical protein WDZ93_01560 [Candidatus Paceibacterota bacterium]
MITNLQQLRIPRHRLLAFCAGVVCATALATLYHPLATFAQVSISGSADFLQNLSVVGSLSKGSGTFVIDHPLDPENKLLYHSFVESPDVKNIYDGVATLNENGEAVVTLPDYFEALNDRENVRFLLTPIGEPGPTLHVRGGVENNRFTIAGGPPSAKVSWQVTGIRHDPYILANPIEVEVEKGPDALVEQGEYIHEGYYDDTNE